jgi:hypothetical protein
MGADLSASSPARRPSLEGYRSALSGFGKQKNAHRKTVAKCKVGPQPSLSLWLRTKMQAMLRSRLIIKNPSSLDSSNAYAISLAWLLSTIDCSHEAPICTSTSDRPFTHSM